MRVIKRILFKRFSNVATLLLLAMLLNACASRKEIAYFNDISKTSPSQEKSASNLKFQKGDILSIQIIASDLESTVPFNLPDLSTGSQLPNYTNGIANQQGYLVDPAGNIEMPVIGSMRVSGLTRTELISEVKGKLKPHIKDPVVHIRLLNFKVTVLGDVRSPGTFTIPNERISILEAIGIAGDLNITAIRKNVLVIREIDNVKTSYRLDLTSSSVLNSPVYYLKQNDVVYVEPNRAQRNSASINSRAGILISGASLLLSFIILFSK
jgi:polysaccharide export outer membrane protein